MDWLSDFLKFYFTGQREEAYEVKKNQIPKKLFKFQLIEDARISSIMQNKIWFLTHKELNDPYDCIGVYWDEEDSIVTDTFKRDEAKRYTASLHPVCVFPFASSRLRLPVCVFRKLNKV